MNNPSTLSTSAATPVLEPATRKFIDGLAGATPSYKLTRKPRARFSMVPNQVQLFAERLKGAIEQATEFLRNAFAR